MRTIALLLVVATAACDRAVQPASNVTVRDEDGVRIIENMSLVADSTAWWVDTTSAVIIGELEGDAPYVFGRVAGVVRQSNGRIVVGDAQAGEVRFFDASGRHLHTVGRKGSGPGEYTYFSRVIGQPSDTLVVIDREGGRRTVLDPDGKYVRSVRSSGNGNGVDERAVFADGSLLMDDFLNTCRQVDGGGALCVDSARWARVAATGDTLATYGVLPFERDHTIRMSPGRFFSTYNRLPQLYWAVHLDRFYWADSERFEIKVFDPTGRIERVVRVRYERPAPTERTFPNARLDPTLTGERRREREEIVKASASAPVPERLPAHRGVMVDRAGNMWIQEYPVEPDPKTLARWFVIDSAGVLRYTVRVPLTILPPWVYRWRGEIGDDYVLGTHRDDLGVESVRMYALRKTPRAR